MTEHQAMPSAAETTTSFARSARAQDSKILSAEVQALRGIPGRVELDLAGSNGPASLLILGDNGSGKSSILDGLQFALQGRIRAKPGPATRPTVSYATDELPRVAVAFADGTQVEREVVAGEDGELEPRVRGKASSFANHPLILRRADILRFWETPAEERQLMFLPYFRPGQGSFRELPHERASRLRAERIKAKTARDNAVRALALEAKIGPGEIPVDLGEYNQWVDSQFFGGRNRHTQRLRKPRRLPRRLYQRVQNVRSEIKTFRAAERQLAAAERDAKRPAKESELADVLEEASSSVTEAFRSISPNSAADDVRLHLGESTAVALEVEIVLENERVASPLSVLSEANRDLIAFLIFVAIAKAAVERHGQAPLMFLDDVFQSVDGPVRVAAVDHILRDLPDWQFAMTAHDRLWYEQLRTLFRRNGKEVVAYEILDWSLSAGPSLRRASGDISGALTWALERADAGAIAVQAGRLLEQVADVLSWTFPVSVTRREGDRYTLGDLWPPVFKVLRRTGAGESAQEVDRYLHLRNLLGAHPNPWAEAASLSEVRRFGESVLAVLASVQCSECGRWVEAAPQRLTFACRCGKTTLSPQAKS